MLNYILLDQAAGGNAGMMNILMIVLLVFIFYFFMIRPQQKRQKEIRKAREAMKEGDRVVTAGGIYGRIRKIKETTFVVEISQGVCITIDKNSVYASAEDVSNDPDAQKN